MTDSKKKVAVILCGSGFKDGSEIRESVGILWALSRHSVDVDCFAFDTPQYDVINCLTGLASDETRNQLVESARIARGKIQPLEALNPDTYSAIVLPGGFGAAKNLCDFALKGSSGSAQSLVQEKLLAFHQNGKPIGAVCIAPAVLALAMKGKGFKLTVGATSEVSGELEKLGHHHVVTSASDCCIDTKNKIVSTPAYMYDGAPLCEIFEGIRKCIDEVIKLS